MLFKCRRYSTVLEEAQGSLDVLSGTRNGGLASFESKSESSIVRDPTVKIAPPLDEPRLRRNEHDFTCTCTPGSRPGLARSASVSAHIFAGTRPRLHGLASSIVL
jgi:hypothetical protein